jgi:hypothetical protein
LHQLEYRLDSSAGGARFEIEDAGIEPGDIAVLAEVDALQPKYRKEIQKRRDAFDREFRDV